MPRGIEAQAVEHTLGTAHHVAPAVRGHMHAYLAARAALGNRDGFGDAALTLKGYEIFKHHLF